MLCRGDTAAIDDLRLPAGRPIRRAAKRRLSAAVMEVLEERRLLSTAGIGVNFTGTSGAGGTTLAPDDVAGVVPLAHYNNFTSTVGSQGLITDSYGYAIQGASMTVSATGPTWSGDVNSVPPGPDGELMKGGLTSGGAPNVGATYVVSLTLPPILFGPDGMFPTGSFGVIVYSQNNSPNDYMVSAFTVNGATRYIENAPFPNGGLTFDGDFVPSNLASYPGGGLVHALDATATESDLQIGNYALFAGSDLSLTENVLTITFSTQPDAPGSLNGYERGEFNGFELVPNGFPAPPPPASPAQLVITQQPANSVVGAPDQMIVDVEDAAGNVITNDDSAVALSIATGPAGASLSGVVTAQAVDGAATFNDVVLNTSGTYTLAASDGSLTGATTDSFTVGPAWTSLGLDQPPQVIYGAASVALSANVSAVGPSMASVNEGTVTFTVYSGATAIATVTGAVSNGSATAQLPLGGISAESYTVSAGYSDAAGNFLGSTSAAPVPLVINRATPIVTWANPASIGYGTPLGAAQLDAAADVAGAFTYTPASGTELPVGLNTLQVTFTPDDTTDYTTVTRTVGINVIGAVATTVGGFAGGYGWTGSEDDYTGASWAANDQPVPAISGDSVQMTTAHTQEASSLFYNQPVDILDPFTVSFVYRRLGGTSTPADGLAFVVQNDPRGANAIGQSGSGLGYGTEVGGLAGDPATGPIVNSLALELNVYQSAGVGVGMATDGYTYGSAYNADKSTTYPGIGPVDLLHDPVQVTLSYNGAGVSTITFNDLTTGAISTQQWNYVIPTIVGGDTAYIGFTGGTGALDTNQYVSDFSFHDSAPATTVLAVNPATGIYGGSATLTASLSALGTPLPGEAVTFSVLGTPVGTAVTDASGTATLSGVSLARLAAGTYSGIVTASFAGDANYAASSASGTLVVSQATPVVSWPAPASLPFGTPISAAQLDATASVPGTFVYSVPQGTILPVGENTLQVTFTPTDSVDYAPLTQSVNINIDGNATGPTVNQGPIALSSRRGQPMAFSQKVSISMAAGAHTFALANLPSGVTLSAATIYAPGTTAGSTIASITGNSIEFTLPTSDDSANSIITLNLIFSDPQNTPFNSYTYTLT